MFQLILTPMLLFAAAATPVERCSLSPLPACRAPAPACRAPAPAPAPALAPAPIPLAAHGTFTQTSITSLDVQAVGAVTILRQTSAGTVTGTLQGTFEDRLTVIVQPNGRFVAVFTLTCTCTVDGRSGTVTLRAADVGRLTSPTEGSFTGVAVIIAATGDLAGLRGVLGIEGKVDLPTGLSTYDYAGTLRTRW